MKSILVSGKKDAYYKKLTLSFIMTNIVGWIVYISGGFVDSILGGRLFNEKALAAVGIVMPITTILYFLSCLIGNGLSVVHSKLIGENNFKKADQLFGTSLIFSVILGMCLAGSLYLLKTPVLSIFDLSEDIYQYASDYYNPLILYAGLLPILENIYYTLASDAAFKLILFANGVTTLCNIGGSILFSKSLGIAGLSLATALSTIVNIIIFSTHYLQKGNTYKFRWYFSLKDIGKLIVIGAGKSSTTLFTAVVDLILNFFICRYIGDIYIAPYSLINFATSIATALEMCGQSVGIISAFAIGEKNNIDVKDAIRICKKENIFLSLSFSIVYMGLFAVWPMLYNITTPELVIAAKEATLIIGPIFIFFGINYIYENYYTAMEKPLIAFLSNFFNIFILPLIFSLVLGSIFKFVGICIAFSICTPITYLILRIYIQKKYHTEFLLPVVNENQYIFEYQLDTDSIIKLRDQVIDLLKDNNVQSNAINKIALTIEELLNQSLEVNKKKVNGRLFIDISDNIKIIIKDNGKIVDLTNQDEAVTSLSKYVLSSMLSQTSLSANYACLSTNAHSLVFDK